MKLLRLFIYIFLGIQIIYSCAPNKTEAQWIEDNTSELRESTGYDFNSIKEAIGNKRIVALGESTHGSGTFYELKSELVQYLHREMGFEVLAIESGLGDAYLSFANIDTLSSQRLRDYSVFGNFRAHEALGLFEYLKSQSSSPIPLNYVGYDTQASSEYLFDQLKDILKDYDKELSDSLSTRMFSYQRSYGYGSNEDSINYLKHRDIFVATSNSARRYLEQNKEAILSKHNLNKTTYSIMVRSLRMFSTSYNLPYENRWEGFDLRDSLMADNIEWLLTEVYPDKKVVIWAHNAHIEKEEMENGYMKTMGQYLKERHPEEYYSIGIFAYSGVIYQFWTKDIIQIENIDSSFLEHRLISSGKIMPFLDLSNRPIQKSNNSWIFKPINAYEVENGGIVKFIPTKRFNAVIVAKESKAPTYDE